MSEKETIRQVQALIISRTTYSLPFHITTKAQEERIDANIRTAYKAALGLTFYASNDKLSALGIFNTFQEIRETLLALFHLVKSRRK